jgi:CHRD domain
MTAKVYDEAGVEVANGVFPFAHSAEGGPNHAQHDLPHMPGRRGICHVTRDGAHCGAETVQLKADLKGSTAAATGDATVTYDTVSKQVSWRITYSGLSGTPTAAHFHGPAQPGANAGVAVPIPNVAPAA